MKSIAAVSVLLLSCALKAEEPHVGVSSSTLLTGEALFVVAAGGLSPSDAALKARMEALGLAVHAVEAAALSETSANGYALVVISRSSNSSLVNTKFRNVDEPVVSMQDATYDDMGLTSAASGSRGIVGQQTAIRFTAASAGHQLTAGRTGQPSVVTTPRGFVFGVPTSAALKIATIQNNTGQSTIFAYEAGAQMVGLTAPSRRVGFFTAENTGASLDADGKALFDAAVTWAAWAGYDTDGDRLANGHEIMIGTNAQMFDTDEDGIGDGDEKLGTENGILLQTMGANPLRKTLLLEHDFFAPDAIGCAMHVHDPSAVIGALTSTYATAPVWNPDGSQGVDVIHDYGQGGLLDGGGQIFDADGMVAGGIAGAEYQHIRDTNFELRRRPYFHYVLHVHGITGSTTAGQADFLGTNVLISNGCTGPNTGLLMHELGHNLGREHGGNEVVDRKPSYNSVMNSRFVGGIDINCNPIGSTADMPRTYDYSYGNRLTLNENALNESLGICGSGWPVDWNGNGAINAGTVSVDVNGDGMRTVLLDHDDWGALELQVFAAGQLGGLGAMAWAAERHAQRVVSCP